LPHLRERSESSLSLASIPDLLLPRICEGFTERHDVPRQDYSTDECGASHKARMTNIWAAVFVLSPFLGPFFGGFIVAKTTWFVPTQQPFSPLSNFLLTQLPPHSNRRWAFWVESIATGLGLVLVILLIDETFYNRAVPVDQQPPRGTRLTRLLGIPQWRSRKYRYTFWDSFTRPFRTVAKPVVALAYIYYMLVSLRPLLNSDHLFRVLSMRC
jgi:MFS family permease